MLDKIIKEDSRVVRKKQITYQLEDIKIILSLIESLIKEYAEQLELDAWRVSCLPVLFKCYTVLSSMGELLESFQQKDGNKDRIFINNQDISIYFTMHNLFSSHCALLRHMYFINLDSGRGWA